MPRAFHPCAFNFRTTNIRRLGSVVDGGRSLSGLSAKVETDGGGYLQADFTNGSTRTKQQGNAWRALTDALGGGEVSTDVMLCSERLFQPVGGLPSVPHSDATPFSDDSEYVSGGASYRATSAASLRATTLQIAGVSELSLIGGELFSIEHATWGWRAYRVNSVDGGTISFLPPLREAVDANTPLEFDTPRCRMVLLQATDNTTDQGRFTACAASFVEDMRKP